MIIEGDALTVLKRMDDESVHMAVTSSPYYGLRSYGTEPIIWDGEPNCEHEWISKPIIRKGSTNGRELSTLVSAGSEKTIATGNTNSIGKTKQFRSDTSNFCSKCGAWKGELGQEPTPELFVKHLTIIFHELKRVLRNDGVLWMNIGDSYAGTGAGQKDTGKATYTESSWPQKRYKPAGNIKPKDLIGIPWMLAFSMRADGAASPQTMYTVEKIKSSLLRDYDTWNDVPKHTKRTIENLDEEWLKASKGGWYLRGDLVWIKRNSMPSSVTDRPCSSIEHVFLFSKSPKYYYDHIATMQPSSESYNKDKRPRGVIRQKVNENTKYDRNDPQYAKFETITDGLVALVPKQDGTGNNTYTGFNDRYEPNGLGLRYMRDSDFFFKTWQGLLHNEDGEPMALVVNPKGYKGAHFACVDSETEALTRTGWKKYFDIQEGELIAAYNNVDGNVRWEKSHINKYNYDGTLISIEKRDASQLMTADHRCLVRKRVSQGKKPSINKVLVKTADQLNSRMDLKMCAPWESDEYCEESIGIAMASLVGWYITEGHISKNGKTACISQSLVANPDKVKCIRNLLIELNAEFKERIYRRTWRGRPSDMVEFQIKNAVATLLIQYAPGKHHPLIPKMINLPYKERFALLNAIIDGDGHRRKDGRISISQNAGLSMDLFQALAVRCGYRTILRDRINTTNNNQILYLTKGEWLTLRTTDGKFEFPKKVKYNGIVWCPTVESTFWVARRNGKTFITGNSFPVKLCEPLILAGTSEKGVCPQCGAPWVRILEKKRIMRHELPQNNPNYRPNRYTVKSDGSDDYSKGGGQAFVDINTTGWKPTCNCGLDPIPATVLDPFSGSSATGVACKLHNRTYIGIELNPEYVKLGEQRIKEGK